MNATKGVSHAHIPFEAISLVSLVLTYGFYCLPNILNGMDSVATEEIISSPLFDDAISKHALAYVRFAFAGVFVLTTICKFLEKGNILTPTYLKTSKLVAQPIDYSGIGSQFFFTQWCWNVLTFSFILNGCIALQSARRDDRIEDFNSNPSPLNLFLHPYAFRCSILLFEIAAPTSMLVSCVTKYALWPNSLRGPNGSKNLRKPTSLIQHNLNIIATLTEVGVLGKIPIRLEDCLVAPVFGIVYLIFMWSLRYRLVENKSPQFIYFFFDTTIGKKWTMSVLIGLLTILMFFFFIFTLVDDILLWFDGGIVTHVVLTVGFASLFCRFRD